MPWVEKNGKGWRPVYRHEGKNKKGPTCATDEEALRWLEENHGLVRGYTIIELAELWGESAPNSRFRNDDVGRVTKLCTDKQWHRVRDLTPSDLSTYMQGGRQNVCRIKSLKRLLRWSQDIHRIEVKRDILRVKPPVKSQKPQRRLLTEKQVADIENVAKTMGGRAYHLIRYLLRYAARPISAVRLCRRHLHGTQLTIENAKHSGTWTHPVTAKEAKNWLELTKGPPWNGSPDAPLFPHFAEDRPWRIVGQSAREVTNWYRRVARKAKLPAGQNMMYDLKRYGVTGMLSAGLDPATIALFTGHKKLDVLLTYNKSNEHKANAALKIIQKIWAHPK